MTKPLTCGVHPTDFMIQLCAISVTLDYIESVVIIGFRYPYQLSEYQLKVMSVQHYPLLERVLNKLYKLAMLQQM